MASEIPLRFIGRSGAGNWPVGKDASAFPSSGSLAAEELGLLLERNRLHGTHSIIGPSRSGSAPPSMEGSLKAFELPRAQHSSEKDACLKNLTDAAKNQKSEEQLRAIPAYLAYYSANVNLNPRLPPPLISRENRHLAHHSGSLKDYLKVPSIDDSFKTSTLISRAALSIHREETEDESSPRQEANDQPNVGADAFSGQLKHCSQHLHGRLVDSTQEDYQRSTSPINSVPSQLSSCVEQAASKDNFCDPRYISSLDLSKQEQVASTSGVQPHFPQPGSDLYISKLEVDSVIGQIHRSSSPNIKVGFHQDPKADLSRKRTNLLKNASTSSGAGSDPDHEENILKNLSISSDDHKTQHTGKRPQHTGLSLQGPPLQAQYGQQRFATQVKQNGMNPPDLFPHGQPKLSFPEVQPVLHSNVIPSPFYAAAPPYGSTYYPNFQAPGLFSPQFNLSGYPLNTSIVPPLITGYPHIPVPVENPVNPNVHPGASGVSSGGNVFSITDTENLYKIYGQLGASIQPPFPDQLFFPYYQHPSVDTYSTSSQFDSMITRASATVSPSGSYDPQKGPAPSVYASDLRSQVPGFGGINAFNARKGSIVDPNYHASSPRLGVLTQHSNSPVSRSFQESAAGTSFYGRRNDTNRYPFIATKCASGWQGQRVSERSEDPKSTSILEELRMNKPRRPDLSDIAGRIVEFSKDQYGSRFIQQRLETCSPEEKESIFKEVLPHASTLMIDVFGNYVIQKFFEHGTLEQQKELANKLTGNILSLSLQMYGCRVIQKALEVIELEQKTQLVRELDGHIIQCVHDQNGNHVIQKCIECIPTKEIGFIMSAFHGQIANLSKHPYGCRVIQRLLEHCSDESQIQLIVNEILMSACLLAQDQYGNYVTQHVLEKGKPHERCQIISALAGHILQMSQHKFASNVVEKCFEYGDDSAKEQLIKEIVRETEGNDNLLVMMKDQYANYVVQKMIETCTSTQRDILLNRVKVHLPSLKKYTYGKHIIACVEQLSED